MTRKITPIVHASLNLHMVLDPRSLYTLVFTIHHSPLTIDQQYMYRCITLAKRGAGHVAPNPLVGAVLVRGNEIIGEGWHKQYGGPHAEVHCIQSSGQATSLNDTTLYVSLEPCAHFGKTPPCVDLIIKHQIPRVVIGCLDPFDKVNGKGIERLRAAGVEVEVGVLEKECKELNTRFFTFHTKQRPYVILKWAETKDGFINTSPPTPLQRRGASESSNLVESSAFFETQNPPLEGREVFTRLLISNPFTNRLVHKWRSEEAAILVGTNTALLDNPHLTTRLWPGESPVRVVIDMDLKLPVSHHVFNKKVKTIIFNSIKQEDHENLLFHLISKDAGMVQQVMNALYKLNIQSVLVEGGAKLLQSFIDEGVWDEARVIVNRQLTIGEGLTAPVLSNARKLKEEKLVSDTIRIYKRVYSR